MQQPLYRIIFIAWMLVGAGFVAVGVKMLSDDLRFLADAAAADAVVVDVVEVRQEVTLLDSDNILQTYVESRWNPVVEFVTTSEQLVRVQAVRGGFPSDPQVGERVRILYDPEDPTRLRFDTFDDRWPGIFVTVTGLAFLGTGPYAVGQLGELGL